jgi:hypothetical protein
MPVFEFQRGDETWEVEAPDQDTAIQAWSGQFGGGQQPAQQQQSDKLSLEDIMPERAPSEPTDIGGSIKDYASDIGQGLASGVVHQGLAGLAGLPHALGDLGDYAAPWMKRNMGAAGPIAGAAFDSMGNLNDFMPSQQDVNQWIGEQGYEEYDPKTLPGSAAKVVGEWVPFVVSGPAGAATRTGKIVKAVPSILLRAGKMAALSEVGGQAGRQLGGLVGEQYKDTGEIIGRVGAAVVGGIHSGSKVRGAKTIKQYDKAVNNSYKRIKDARVSIDDAQETTKKLVNQVKGAESSKALGGQHEAIDKIMNNWAELVGLTKKGVVTKAPSAHQIIEFEKQLNALKSGNVGKLAYKLESTLDDLAFKAGGTNARLIRQDFAALKKQEYLNNVDEAIDVASGGLVGGDAQGIRIKFTQLWRQMHPTTGTPAAAKKAKRIQAMFSPKELKLIKALADPNGVSARKMFEMLGKEGQNRVAISLGILLSIGMGNFTPLLGAAALRTGGGVLKRVGSMSAKSKLNQFNALSRGGHTRPIYNPAAAGVGGAVNRENEIKW